MSGSFQAVFSRNSLEKTKPVYIRDGQGKKKILWYANELPRRLSGKKNPFHTFSSVVHQ
jgi:hypothetical protein